MNVNLLAVTPLCVILPGVILLYVFLLNVKMQNVIGLNFSMLTVFMPSVVMKAMLQNAALLNVFCTACRSESCSEYLLINLILPIVIQLNAILPKCHGAIENVFLFWNEEGQVLRKTGSHFYFFFSGQSETSGYRDVQQQWPVL